MIFKKSENMDQQQMAQTQRVQPAKYSWFKKITIIKIHTFLPGKITAMLKKCQMI